ncbi:RCC1 domain-containing protein [Arthrobacter sp. 2RAF6]|uniref:RCC1 domain-containing protein n=1 Tax=Arthrobacter sp. 2RAF6 TaxID=3233002 RepID=UPI003F907AEE
MDPGAMVPIAPSRLLDTRSTAAVGPDSTVSFQVGGVSGIPASVSAVTFNLTVANPSSFGFITAFPSGTTRPNASNLNFATGLTVPNSVTVPVGADGKVTLFNRSSGTTHLIADVSGYYLSGGPAVPGAFAPLAPTRMLDTRSTAAVGPDSTVSFQVGGVSGIPASVSAVTFNLTVANPSSFGFITAFPSGTTRPNASNLNFATGQTVPNSVTVPVGADGKVTLFNRSSGTTHLIADVSGYYLPGSPVGSVWTWGGPNGNSLAARMPDLSGVTQLTGVDSAWFAVLADGTVRAWGDNNAGRLGDGTATDRPTPVQVAGLTGVKSLIANNGSAYALHADGTVSTWGGHLWGALGTGTGYNSAVPFKVPGLSGVTALADGGGAVFALLNDGTVRAWGSNGFGQLGIGTTVDAYAPVPVPGLTDVTKIVPGYTATYALLADGTVRAWGRNDGGQFGNGTTTSSNTPVQVTGLTGVKTITEHGGSIFALLNDGTLRAWGGNFWGRLGIGTTTDISTPTEVTGLTGVASVISDSGTTFALLTDGTVRAWGDGQAGQFGNGTANFGTISSTPVHVEGLTDVQSLTAANGAAYALLADGTVRAWGDNLDGQLGNGITSFYSLYPVQIPGLIGIRSFQINTPG